MRPLALAGLESFHIGGEPRALPSDGYGAALPPGGGAPCRIFVAGAMYVQRLVPAARRCAVPLILIHGGCHTGVTWETTPDGREGWQTLLVRRGFETCVVDQPWRGRSAADLTPLDPSIRDAGPLGVAFSAGMEMAALFARGGGRFPLDRAADYAAQLQPDFGIAGALAAGRPGQSDPRALGPLLALIDRLGPVALVTHSQGADLGWKAALARPDKVSAILAIEPGVTGPDLDDPAFPDIPVRIMWGDNLPEDAFAISLRDVAEARAIAARRPNVELDLLPEAGIRGNGHMLMMDDNNAELAARAADWLLDRLGDGS